MYSFKMSESFSTKHLGAWSISAFEYGQRELIKAFIVSLAHFITRFIIGDKWETIRVLKSTCIWNIHTFFHVEKEIKLCLSICSMIK